MCSFKSIYFVIFILNLYRTEGQISDKRLCANDDCTELLSLARTLLKYSSPHPLILSFIPNQDVKVFSKEAGSVADLWGVEIGGKRGYVNKNLIREYKVIKKPTILVGTEIGTKLKSIEIKPEEKIETQKVQEPFEIIDGTTVYTGPESISPSTTESPVIATETPSLEREGVVETESLTKENSNKQLPQQTENGGNNVINNIVSPMSSILDNGENDDEDDGEDDDDEEDESLEEDEPESINTATPTTNTSEAKTEDAQVKENPKVEEVASQPEQNSPQIPEIKSETDTKENETPPAPAGDVKTEPIKKEETSTEKVTQIEESPKEAPPEETKPKEFVDENKSEETKEVPPPQIQKGSEESIEIRTNSEATTEAIPIISSENSEEKNKAKPESTLTENISQLPVDAANEEVMKEEPVEQPKKVQTENTAVDPEIPLTTTQSSIDEEEPYWDLDEVTPDPLSEENIQEEIEEKKPEPAAPILPSFGLGLFQNSQPEEQQKSIEIEESVGVESSNETEEETVTSEELVETIAEESKEIVIEQQNIPKEIEKQEEINDEQKVDETPKENEQSNAGFVSNILSFFGSSNSEEKAKENNFVDAAANDPNSVDETIQEPTVNVWSHQQSDSETSAEKFKESCNANIEDCFKDVPKSQDIKIEGSSFFDDIVISFNSDIFLYLVTTAISVIIFLFGYVTIDKSKREGPLVARISKLEQQLLVATKENELLQENKIVEIPQTVEIVDNEAVEDLTQKLAEAQLAKAALEEQVAALEKELDTSTEVGMELNRIVSEMLSSTNGSDILKASVEQMQRQLLEQQDTIATISETLRLKEMENHELRLELEISNKKVVDLQGEVDKMVEKVLRIEEERDQQQSVLEREITTLERKFMDVVARDEALSNEIQMLRTQLLESQRETELKTKEYKTLKESLKDVKTIGKNNDVLKTFLDVSEIKAKLEQLKNDNNKFSEQLQIERQERSVAEKRYEMALKEIEGYKGKYEQADKEKVEINTKLEVLNNYFKEKEAELQKEIGKYESMWKTKEGEAVSTIEQIRYMEERLEIYKQQNEGLKEEIVNQEVELKSQISMLEKKVHENWVTNRQLERKLEDARQEAAQLRHKLTLREMSSLAESNAQNRLQSPLLQNGGDHHPLSPPLDSSSPLFGGRLATTSPPLAGLPPPPHPFLPPPPGAPFLPPPPFAPPPPPPAAIGAFPGDRRPPPLGRMSSPPPPPPLGRYTPGSEWEYGGRAGSPSPGYASESDYGYGRREYGRGPARVNGRGGKGSTSGSDPANDSLADKKNRKPSNMV